MEPIGLIIWGITSLGREIKRPWVLSAPTAGVTLSLTYLSVGRLLPWRVTPKGAPVLIQLAYKMFDISPLLLSRSKS